MTMSAIQFDAGRATLARAVSIPGGMARQFRVQRLDADQQVWRLHATFSSRTDAANCLGGLLARGERARVIDCHYPATAA